MATSMVSRCLIFRTLGDHCKRELHHRLLHDKLTCYAKSKSIPLSLPRRYASNTFETQTNKRPYRRFRWLLVTTGTGTLLYLGVRRSRSDDNLDHKLATNTQMGMNTTSPENVVPVRVVIAQVPLNCPWTYEALPPYIVQGYGSNFAMSLTRKLLYPSRHIWRTVRRIKPKEILLLGLQWGLTLHQVHRLVNLHQNILRQGPKVLRRSNRRSKKGTSQPTKKLNSTIKLYRKMPLKAMSRAWGKFNEFNLPIFMRKPLLGLYIWMFGCNLEEALDENLKNYKNLGEFFRRQLKPDARTINADQNIVTSPSDGKILHFGKVENGVLEQIKGITYSLNGFLGPQTHVTETKNMPDRDNQCVLGVKADHDLFHCTVYLAPGDYHRFHSPTDWTIQHRRHFPGELLSVNPGIVRWIQGLFNFNERVVYTGVWQHGFFSYTAVGATNVGSIKIYCDKELSTNMKVKYPEGVYFDRDMKQDEHQDGIPFKKGDMIGEFNLGSTIVLIFEAPKDFKFCVTADQKIKFGQSIGTCSP